MLTPADIRGRKMVDAAHVDFASPKRSAWVGTVEGIPRLGIAKWTERGQTRLTWSVDGVQARDLEHALAVLNGLELIGPTPDWPSGAGAYPRVTELLERAGRWDLITPAMWAAFDADVAAWQHRYVKDLPKGNRR